ncbi:MAG: hypothetical protein Q4A32_04960 [Lachnospiraceae bacterium]|nr:hypothetical protein [Lachnospiraceae bacterium]
MSEAVDLRYYTLRENMWKLTDEQRMFVARRIEQETQRIAKELAITEEAAYRVFLEKGVMVDIPNE